MPPINDDGLLSLFAVVLSGRGDDYQVRQLDELLATDDRAVELFALFAQQEVDLRHLLKTSYNYRTQASRTVPANSPESKSRATDRTSLIARIAKRSTSLFVAAAVLLMFVTGAIYSVSRSGVPSPDDPQADQQISKIAPVVITKPPAPVAVLTDENGAVWQGPKIYRGQSLREGDALTLIEGDLRISMGFGAEIAAKGPCALRIVARDRVQLEFGEVAVHVAEWAHGFVVETPTMDVVDLGTTFVVSASKNENSKASVIKGQVRVSPRQVEKGNPKTVLLSTGQALLVERTGRQTTITPKPEDAIDFGNEHPYRPIGLHNSGYGLSVGDVDMNWRITAGPSDTSFTEPQFAIVCMPDERYLQNDRNSSQWISMEKWRDATPDATYTFEMKFDLTDFDVSTVQLFGRFLADNGINEVRVNGKAVMLESWVDNIRGQQFSLPQFRTVNVTTGLIRGTNTIEIDVLNARASSRSAEDLIKPNPMALRVEWEGFGRPNKSPDADGS